MRRRIPISLLMVSLISLISLIEPCFADPIPVPPPPTHIVFIQLTTPILVNYLWNFTILGVLFHYFKVRVRNKKFALFILALTFLGLFIDGLSYALALTFATLNFPPNFMWILFAGVLLFIPAYSLTWLVYKLSKRRCCVSGLVFGIASNPIVGITFIVPILARFSLLPPL